MQSICAITFCWCYP